MTIWRNNTVSTKLSCFKISSLEIGIFSLTYLYLEDTKFHTHLQMYFGFRFSSISFMYVAFRPFDFLINGFLIPY